MAKDGSVDGVMDLWIPIKAEEEGKELKEELEERGYEVRVIPTGGLDPIAHLGDQWYRSWSDIELVYL